MPDKIKLPNERAYDEAGKGDHSLFSTEHCCVCGRPAKGDNWLLLSRAADGSREFAIASPLHAEEKRSVWIAPVGPECLRQHPELRFALLVTAEQFDALRKPASDALDFIEAVGRDIHYVYSPEAAATVSHNAAAAITALRRALGSEKKGLPG